MDKPNTDNRLESKEILATILTKRLAKLSKEQVSELKNQLSQNQKQKEVKPDWITDEQWEAIPYSDHWLNQKEGAEYIKQSKPATMEEVHAQFERLRNEKNWKELG